ncbi:CbtA family protein [Pseudomonas sp. C2L12B]|nr:CbtA family protein [Pseudomonas typographi]MBD1586538.1 CbtA family protein [Pseudomonas typographi]
MTGNLLLRGLFAGLLAGMLAFGFATVFGEPQVDRAIAFEESTGHEHSHGDASAAPEEEEVFSRQTQAGIGLFTGVMVYSLSMGGLFALVFAYAMGRLGAFGLGPRGLAALLAMLALVAVFVVPGLKYPANPPAVGDPATIGQRTRLFFLLMLVSVAAMVLAINAARALLPRLGGWNATLLAGLLYGAVMVAAAVAFPTFNEVPEHFPASLLWQFRVASLGIQVVLWAALGLAFGWLAERYLLGAPKVRLGARLRG